MEDIRLKELRYIIESFNQSDNLTDVALKNIIEFLDYTEIRFNKVVSDHKAVVEDKDKLIYELESTLAFAEKQRETLRSKIEELEKGNNKFKDSLQFIATCQKENEEDLSLINEICELFTACMASKGD